MTSCARPEGDVLPEPFASWIGEALQGDPPPEPLATCHDCVMCRPPEVRVAEPPYLFDPSVKCCTYLPELANFQIGRILGDGSPDAAAGRRTVRERIAAGVAVTPLGLFQTEGFLARYRPHGAAFGRDPSFRCPHFLADSGRCSVWRHRESTCSTWSCKHERGAVGRDFRSALRTLLKQIEGALAGWCACEAGLAETEVEGEAGDAWRGWAGRPEEFYLDCAKRTDGLAWSDVRAIAGPALEAPLQSCRTALALLRDASLPERLSVGDYRVVGVTDSSVRTGAYSPFDPLDVPRPLFDLLPRFDGRPTGTVLREIETDRGLRIESDALRPLVDFGILVRS